MASRAVHSHLLLGLMTIHATIIVYLFVSQMYLTPQPRTSRTSDTTTTTASPEESKSTEKEFDLNTLKVIVAIGAHVACFVITIGALVANNIPEAARRLPPVVIVVTLIFALVFNAAGALCLVFHQAPNYPGGFSRSIRTSMILSFATVAYTVPTILVFCIIPPGHDSIRGLSAELLNQPPDKATENVKEKGKSKEKPDEKKSDEGLNKDGKKEPLEPSPVDYWASADPGKVGMPPPPPLPPPGMSMPPPPGSEGKKEGEGLYENLEVPPGFVAPPPPPPPP